MAPFFGPYSLGNSPASTLASQITQKIPGAQISSFAGQGGTTASLGFTHSGPLLFQGQPLSSSSSIQTAPALASGGRRGQPESITALLSGLTVPSLPAISTGSQSPIASPVDTLGGGGITSAQTALPLAEPFTTAPKNTLEELPMGAPLGTPSGASNANTSTPAFGDTSSEGSWIGHALDAVNANTLAARVGGEMGASPTTSNVVASVIAALTGPFSPAVNAINTGVGIYGALGETAGQGVPGVNVTPAEAASLDAAVGGLGAPAGPAGLSADASAAGGENAPSAGYGEASGFGSVASAHGMDGLGGGPIGYPGSSQRVVRLVGPEEQAQVYGTSDDSDKFAWRNDDGSLTPIWREGVLAMPGQVLAGGPDTGMTAAVGAPLDERSSMITLLAGHGAEGGTAGSGDGGSGGGSTVICTELHRQGYLPEDIYQLDRQFGEWVYRNHPDVYAGYIAWAPLVVRVMQHYPWTARLVGPFVRAWAKSMACLMEPWRKPSLLGSLMMAVGVPICRAIGQRMRRCSTS